MNKNTTMLFLIVKTVQCSPFSFSNVYQWLGVKGETFNNKI